MCGIAGILCQGDLTPIIHKMVATLNHRGPDDRGEHIAQDIALGNTRLAIIDLSPAGHMPMHDPRTGNWITFNGEIYNFQIVRQELEAHGLIFNSGTDTEVVLKAYQKWGVACVERLRGMFAFAIWDAARRELFLARDRVGEKPLYYVEDVAQRRFLFASEIRTLLATDLVEPRLDRTTLSVYLHNGFAVAPRTFLHSARSLMPGCWMRVGLDGAIREIQRYWQIPTFEPDEETASLDEIRHTLSEAVQMRMISDVPLGAFLSGGLDSSTIVALMSRASEQVRTFSIGFHERAYDESTYAKWVANRFHTDHTSITLGPREFTAWLDDGLSGMDQPTYDGLNTYFVSRAARESGLTVALSGLGGDELFGGYPFFSDAPVIAALGKTMARLPTSLKRRVLSPLAGIHGFRKAFHILEQPIPPDMHLLAGYQTRLALFPQAEQSSLLADSYVPQNTWFGLPQEFVDFVNEEGRDADPLSQLSRYVLHLFEGERTLRDSDSMSMAVSLEIRTAFTDHILIETLWKLPGKVRCAGAPDKPYQETLVRPILGDDYPAHKKQGFTFPFQDWLQTGETFERVRATLRNTDIAQAAGLDPMKIIDLEKDSLTLPWSRVWTIFALMNWVEQNQVSI